MSVTKVVSDKDLFDDLQVEEINEAHDSDNESEIVYIPSETSEIQEADSESEFVFIPPEDESSNQGEDNVLSSQPLFSETQLREVEYPKESKVELNYAKKIGRLDSHESTDTEHYRDDELEGTSCEGEAEYRLLYEPHNDEMSMSQEVVAADNVNETIETSVVVQDPENFCKSLEPTADNFNYKEFTTNQNAELVLASLTNNCDVFDDDSFDGVDFTAIHRDVSRCVSSISVSFDIPVNGLSSMEPEPIQEYSQTSFPAEVNRKETNDETDSEELRTMNVKCSETSTSDFDMTEFAAQVREKITREVRENTESTQDYDFSEFLQIKTEEKGDAEHKSAITEESSERNGSTEIIPTTEEEYNSPVSKEVTASSHIQDSDTSYGLGDLLCSEELPDTKSLTPASEKELISENSLISKISEVLQVNDKENSHEKQSTTTIDVPETPTLSETNSFFNDHDYLEQRLTLSLDTANTEEIAEKSIEQIICLATGMKQKLGKSAALDCLNNIVSYTALLHQLIDKTAVEGRNKEAEKVELNEPNSKNLLDVNASTTKVDNPEKDGLELLDSIVVKEEYSITDIVVANERIPSDSMEVDEQRPNLVSQQTETETTSDQNTSLDLVKKDDSDLPFVTLEDPILNNLLELKAFGSEAAGKAHEWHESVESEAKPKSTVINEIHEYFQKVEEYWKELKIKFDFKVNTVDASTEIDRKVWSRFAKRDKKELLAAIQSGSDSELEDERKPRIKRGSECSQSVKDAPETDTEAQEVENDEIDDEINNPFEPIVGIIEASDDDFITSDLEDEVGVKSKKEKESQKSEKLGNKESSEDSDASIERLINLKNIGRKRRTEENYQSSKLYKKPEKKNNIDIEELVNGAEDTSGEESEEEPVPKMLTEAEFIKKLNEDSKRQLLESDSSDNTDEEDELSVASEARDTDSDNSDDSDSSLVMNLFLASFGEHQKTAIKNDIHKPSSVDSGVDEKASPKSINRRKSSVDNDEPSPRSKAGDDEDDDVLDLSMLLTTTQRVREIEENADEADTTKGTSASAKTPVVDDCISLSSESDSDSEIASTTNPIKQRHIRPIMSEEQLAAETKDAQKREEQRIRRLEKKSQTLSQLLTQKPDLEEATKDQLLLDYDKENQQPIAVHAAIVRQLKDHQKEGVKFMYDCCYGSIDHIEKYPGSGCILAHCMGLGKTLQLIALVHTVIRYQKLKTNRVLVLCPKSTVLNWGEELEKWIQNIRGSNVRSLKVFCFEDSYSIHEKIKVLQQWHSSTANGRAGCLLLGYEAFRALINYNPEKKNAKQSISKKELDNILSTIERCLVDPGADLVVCDEGHIIKNQKSAINKAVTLIKTKRRIILTGTPIQNNLNEYYCMVNFIKPNFLGTEKEFNNLYANPIKAGQHKDSNTSEIRQMKRRSFVLHKKLTPFVQRKEFKILKQFLPEKFEYVLYIPLTKVQVNLYKIYLEQAPALRNDNIGGRNLLPDYTFLRKVWTHPKVLEMAYQTALADKNRKQSKSIEKNLQKLIDGEDVEDDVFDVGTQTVSLLHKWWDKHVKTEDLETILPSYKLQLMFEILQQCKERGEKCLIFSAYVAVLNVVEYFFDKVTSQSNNLSQEDLNSYKGLSLRRGINYYRLDGKTQKTVRHQLITKFNNPKEKNVLCFLISSRAGGQGINLIGANRVIILDTSWNPSSDQQNIFRIYRLGQKSPCYVYRLLAMGTMEEKVYSRSVTKQAMSHRVVDEQQIDRHYSNSELAELYTLTEDFGERPIPVFPADELLKNLLLRFPTHIFKYHEHDSLLENKDEEDLSEAEKMEAWAQYEQEEKMKEIKANPAMNMFNNQMANASTYAPNMSRYGVNPFSSLSGGSMYSSLYDQNIMSNYGNYLSQMMMSGFANSINDPMLAMLQMGQMSSSLSSNQIGSKTAGTSPSSMYASNPLLGMANLGSLSPSTSVVGSSENYSSISSSVPSAASQNYRSSMSHSPFFNNPSMHPLITGMPQQQQSSSEQTRPRSQEPVHAQQQSANTPSFGTTGARSHPVSGVARSNSNLTNLNNRSVDPIPVKLTSAIQSPSNMPPQGNNGWQIAHRSSPVVTSTTNANKSKASRKQVGTGRAGFEQQYLQQINQNRRPPGETGQVIEIPDDDQPSSSTINPNKSKPNKPNPQSSKVSNIGIQYPGGPPVPTTPIYLPEGISINKIPKNIVSTKPQSITSSATITPVVHNRNTPNQNTSTPSQMTAQGTTSQIYPRPIHQLKSGISINKFSNPNRTGLSNLQTNNSGIKKPTNTGVNPQPRIVVPQSQQSRANIQQSSGPSKPPAVPVRLTKAASSNGMTITPILTNASSGVKRKAPLTNESEVSKIPRINNPNVSIIPKK